MRGCLVCGEPVDEAGEGGLDSLCAVCAQVLPWNRHACPACAQPLSMEEAGRACGACQRCPPPLASCYATFAYRWPMDRLLPGAKFHGDLAASRVLGEWMAAALWRHLPTVPWPEAIVPLPLHRARLRRRGYDQALELARPLARRLRLPLRHDLLLRTRDTVPQSRLDGPARRLNLRNAFEVRGGVGLPRHVVLVDDVMTTGTTLHAAANALRRSGIERVDAWVCARVP